jgi:hypothetical protein
LSLYGSIRSLPLPFNLCRGTILVKSIDEAFGGAFDAAFGDAALGDAAFGDAALGDVFLGDDALGDVFLGDDALGDAAFDDALGDAAFDDALGDAAFDDAFDDAFGCPILTTCIWSLLVLSLLDERPPLYILKHVRYFLCFFTPFFLVLIYILNIYNTYKILYYYYYV